MNAFTQSAKKSFLVLSTVLLAPAFTLASEVMVLDLASANTKVGFEADGKIMKVRGENGKATGKLTIKDGSVSGKALVAIKDLTTGIDLRDDHMKNKYLEMSKYPTASIEIVEIKLPATLPSGSFEAPFTGNLTIHGVAKAVKGVAKLNHEGGKLKGEVEFKTSIAAHKIDVPKHTGIVIKDEVNVKVEFDGALVKSAAGKSVAKK